MNNNKRNLKSSSSLIIQMLLFVLDKHKSIPKHNSLITTYLFLPKLSSCLMHFIIFLFFVLLNCNPLKSVRRIQYKCSTFEKQKKNINGPLIFAKRTHMEINIKRTNSAAQCIKKYFIIKFIYSTSPKKA